MTRLEMLRQIKNDWQARKIRFDGEKGYDDATTASACIAVHDALNETNREKYLALPWSKFVAVTWKLVA